MNKVDQLRALREARFSHATALRHASPPRPATPAASPFGPPAVAAAPAPVPHRDPATQTGQEGSPATVPGSSTSADGAPARERTHQRPDLEPGKSIHSYSNEDMAALVRWITSDGVTTSSEAILEAVMKELGFERRGKVIRARVDAAIASSN